MKPAVRYDLTRLSLVKTLVRARWPQFALSVIALAGFVLAMLAGWLGTPVGSRNFGIVFVWIAWWAILMLLAVPLLGRGWCSICPIPLPGEWLQRGAVLGPAAQAGWGLGKRWPAKLRNIWLQNGMFLLVALFSTVVLTQPRVTAVVLAVFLFVALGASLVFERRAFCRYLCPVGGFIGLYAQLAPVEVRIKDAAVCAAHTEKTCYTGRSDAGGPAGGYGCPWMLYPGGLSKNTYCGMCMECLRSCPHDNPAINIRTLGEDLYQPQGRKLDEAYKAFIMLGAALLYSSVLLGPWGALKAAAYEVGSLPWVGYTLGFLVFILALLPGLFWLCVWVGRRAAGSPAAQVLQRKAFTAFAYSLVPLGLAAWIAFSLSFVLANFSYVWPVLSDPLGWGWNVLGTAAVTWTPYGMSAVPTLQALVLLVGLAWASLTARKIAVELGVQQRAVYFALPVALFCLGATLGMLKLLVG